MRTKSRSINMRESSPYRTTKSRGISGQGWLRIVGSVAAVGLFLPAGAAQAGPASGFTELVSVNGSGVQGDGDSQSPSVSADGRYVAFVSAAGNLVPDDTNGGLDSPISGYDIFVRDRLTGTTERVSVSSNGREADGDSGFLGNMGGPSISADGRYVAFASEATNLVSGDRNATVDVFVHDRQTGTTNRVSVASGGDETGGGQAPDISADGRYISFVSFAEDLVPGDTNFAPDVFLHDIQAGTTERISQAPDGTDANGGSSFAAHISADGNFVYFSSAASNLVQGIETDDDIDAFLFNRASGEMTAVTADQGNPDSFVLVHGIADGMSSNGRYLSFTTKDDQFAGEGTDANGFVDDAWLYDTITGDYTLVGVNDAGEQGDEFTFGGDVSDDGRYVSLVSRATNFGGPANFRENVYQRDLTAGTTSLVSVASDGTFGDLASLAPSMTPDGAVTAYDSRSSTLVPEDSNGSTSDIFVRDGRPAADLELTMTDSPDPVTARQQLTYTLDVTNLGPTDATAISLKDQLPDEELVTVNTSQGTCLEEKIQGDVSLACDLGTLSSGQTATVTIVVVPAREGTVSNSASVKANQPDPEPSNNGATESTIVAPRK